MGHPSPEQLGPPSLRLAAFQLWVHGWQFPEARDKWDGNWLTVTAHCGRARASVWSTGAILDTIGLQRFRDELERLHQTLSGEAVLESHAEADLIAERKVGNLLVNVMSIDQSPQTLRRLLLCCLLLLTAAPAKATEYFDIGLHGRVQASDIVVVARVVDPALALVSVERVLKGDVPKQITLVAYVDGFAVPAQRKVLVADARELMFLTKKGDAYAPVQDQYGRMAVNGDQLVDAFRAEPRNLSQTLASIQRLVALQGRAARGGGEADAAYVAALKDSDVELQMWALWKAKDQIKVPSHALADAVLASWPSAKEVGPVLGSWNAAGLVANTVVTWRLQRAAPFFAKILTTSATGDERAWAAMALGGSGDRAYLPVLRRVAKEDTHTQARALAYRGIMSILGPDSLGDLRLGAKDSDEQVRAQAVVDSYNLLEFGHPEPRWPRPSDALIAEVRTFLTEMQRDPARLVSDNAKSMLAMIARQRQ